MNVFKHGKITLIHGDCMEYLAGLEDKAFELAVVDPPYGVGAENHAGKAENGWHQWEKKEWDKSIPSADYFGEIRRASKNQIVFGGNYMTEHLPPSMGWIFWDKGQRDFSLADGELAWTSFRKALRVFEMSRGACLAEGKRQHPTQKPVKLYQWIYANYAKPTDRILDTHLGSGSSAIAAHYSGLEFVGIELDADYYAAAVERFKRETAQEALF